MATSLATLKALLELPAGPGDQDVALAAALDAAERAILDAAGVDLVATSRTQIFLPSRAQAGRRFQLDYRPVATITSATVRLAGDATETPVTTDLVDAATGRFIVVDFARPEPWGRWQAPRWDRLAVTYQTTATDPLPADLAQAIYELAAYWAARAAAGAYSETTLGNFPIGQIKERYLSLGLPEWVEAKLSPYRRRRARWVS